jgi:uncharacterized protein involved in outer membrane biogenesis
MRWKWIALVGAALIIALAATAYLVLSSYDYSKLKPRIARMVAEATGRELTLGGDIGLDFGFSPALVVTDVALSNTSWASDPQIITARRIEARVRLLPLLFGDVELRNLTLVGVNVALEMDAAGQRNWEFKTSASGIASPKIRRIDVKVIRVTNLGLTYRDQKTARTTRLNLADLEMRPQAGADRLTFKLQANYNGQSVELSGRIGRLQDIISGEKFPLEVAGRFAGATVEIEGTIGEIRALRGINLDVRLSGKDLEELSRGVGARLPRTDAFDISGQLAGSWPSPKLENISGHLAAGGADLAVSGRVDNLMALSGLNLQLKGAGKDLSQAGVVVGQELPSTDAFTLQGELTGSARVLSLREVRGHAQRDSLNLDVTGAIKNLLTLAGLDLALKVQGKELAEIGPLIGTTLPELGPFDLSGHLSGSGNFFSLADLTAVVDRSDFNGQAKVEVRKRPKITLVLDSSLLDLTALLKNLEKGEKESGSERATLKRRLFHNDPLPFDVLKQVDADIRLHAKNVRARDANFEFGNLKLTLEDRDLNVDTLEATYKQTRISGNFHIYPESPPRIAAKFLVQDFDLGGLLRELRISEEVRSHLDIAVDVNSSGVTIHDLMAGLNGSMGAVMGEGYLTRYLDLLSADLTRKVIQFWGEHPKGGEIRCAVVQFDINEGIATSRAFVFDTEAGVLTGEGDINLSTEQVDFLLVPEPRYPSLTDFWTKLRVRGTILDPKVRPDTLSLLTKGAKALGALVLGPVGLLAPFVNLGANKAHPCDIQSVGK